MKPECVSGDEMSDDAWSPQQLCEGVGFLVLEARTPHGVAVKGRVEGPHCPSTPQQGNTHLCCDAADECRRAASVRRQVELFWRNGIPMCIEAALLPACAHGQEAARDTNLEGGSPGSVREENRVLLERWTVNVLPKRHGERSEMSVTPRFLLQAVRSYLHFSQLSAWLSTTKGQLPNPIAYRLLAPGENGSYQFSGKPDLHVFPQADVNQVTVKVSVEALPRIQSIPNVVCRPGNLCGATPLRNFVERSEVAASGLHEKSLPKRCSRDHRLAVNDASNNNTNTRCSDVTNSSQTKLPNSHCSASSERFESADYDQNSNGPSNGQSAKPKVKLKPFDFTAPPGAKSQTKGGKLSHLTPARRKDSPKVLITSSSSTHETFYQKRFLDFDNPDKVHPDTKGQCLDETGWGAMKLSSHLQPEFNCPPRNATEELEAYLSTIAERSLWRDEQLKNIPVRKCKFFIGDQNDELEPSQKDEDVEKTRLHSHPPTTSELADFDSLCKNLYQQDFCDSEEIQQEHLREPDHRKKDFTHSRKAEENVDKLVPFSCQSGAVPPRGEFPVKGEVSPLETNLQLHSPSFVESCVCDAISVQGKITPDVRSTAHSTQNVPAELNNIEQTENISNGNTSPENFVISNGADGKLLQSGTKMSTHFEAAILNKGEKASLLKKNFSYLDQPIPSQREISSFHACLGKASGMVFNTSTGLPSRSSPAPIKKKSSGKFDYDSSLTSARAIKNAISCSKLSIQLDNDGDSRGSSGSPNHTLSTSAPASTNSLLGNFEESVLNGRIEPIGVVEGFTAEIGASGAFCPKHVTLPVTSYFFSLSDDNAPSPYLGHINLASSRRRGYHVPKAGTVQVTLFNPNKTVVKMFVVRYDLTDMPPHCQTFLRQRTLYMPVNQESPQPSFLRYLIHLRFFSSKSGKIYLHTDIRLIFARDKFEFDPRVADYELRSFTEGPQNPKFSPKR